MNERIEFLAVLSVARACGFAALAIAVFVFATSFNVTLALRSGAILSLIVCMALLLKARGTQSKRYDATEVWLMLKPSERPSPIIAQDVVSAALRRAYFRFAAHAAAGSAGMFTASLAWALIDHQR
jgi:hypothetical protein